MFGQFLAQGTSSVADRVTSAADYFKNPSLDFSQILMMLALLALVVGGFLLVRVAFRYRLAKAIYVPAGDIHDAAKINNILDHCILRRSKLEFKITGRQSGQLVSGMPMALRAEKIILAMSVPFNVNHQKMLGEKIHCYFKVHQEKHDVFLNFFSAIELVQQGEAGFLELGITLPEALLAGQKRNFLRIEPPADFILEIAIWPEYSTGETSWRTTTNDFPDPALHDVEGKDKSLALVDISAGGAGIIINRATAGAAGISLTKGARFMLRLGLWDPSEERELPPLWLVCRVQKYLSSPRSREVEIGMQFIAWSQAKNADTHELRWFILEEEDEVPTLGDWVAKRHLEHYRKALVD